MYDLSQIKETVMALLKEQGLILLRCLKRQGLIPKAMKPRKQWMGCLTVKWAMVPPKLNTL
jgi:hypothetical protein